MKYTRLSWAAFSLIAPILLVVALIGVPAGCLSSGGGGSTPPTKKNGFVAVGFVGTPPSGFQNVLVNVSAVRLNPNADAGPNDNKWVTIPVPQGVGQSISAKPGNLQIDLNTAQSLAAFFNTGQIPTNSYEIVEVQLDITTPGTLIPKCTSGGTGLEGCIEYPMALADPSQALTFTPITPIEVSNTGLTPLVLELDLSIVAPPTVSGGVFGVALSMEVVDQQTYLGTVTGNVTNAANQGGITPPSVGAVLTGTNTIIAAAQIKNGSYTLALPAATGLGTDYDIYTFGGTISFEAVQGLNVTPGVEFPQDFTVSGSPANGNISGTITDGCSGLPIVGATVEILVPEVSASTNCTTTPQDCIVVATANTDNAGFYPLPGSIRAPAPFENLPTGIEFALRYSAAGYDPMFTTGSAGTTDKTGDCPASDTSNDCSFALDTAFIKGTVTLNNAPPPGTTVNVQVLAEEMGTNTLVAALPTLLQFNGALTSLDFTLNVPSSIGSFDLIATPVDLFAGAADPFPGHALEVASGVASSGSCAVPGAPTVVLGPMACIGHGSISGVANSPDSRTTVMLSKNGVQLMESPAGPVAPAPSGNTYSFCAPPDSSYTVQRFESGVPEGGSQAVPVMPTPSAQATPCPTTCSFPDTTCPGVCINTAVPNPL